MNELDIRVRVMGIAFEKLHALNCSYSFEPIESGFFLDAKANAFVCGCSFFVSEEQMLKLSNPADREWKTLEGRIDHDIRRKMIALVFSGNAQARTAAPASYATPPTGLP